MGRTYHPGATTLLRFVNALKTQAVLGIVGPDTFEVNPPRYHVLAYLVIMV